MDPDAAPSRSKNNSPSGGVVSSHAGPPASDADDPCGVGFNTPPASGEADVLISDSVRDDVAAAALPTGRDAAPGHLGHNSPPGGIVPFHAGLPVREMDTILPSGHNSPPGGIVPFDAGPPGPAASNPGDNNAPPGMSLTAAAAAVTAGGATDVLLPDLAGNGVAILTAADLHRALNACAPTAGLDEAGDDRLGLLLQVWDGIDAALGRAEDATDPFVLAVAQHVDALPAHQRRLFINFDTRLAATKTRRDRYATLAALITGRWGDAWLSHPYVTRAMKSDDLAKAFRAVVAELPPGRAVVLLSKCIIHRLTINPPYSSTSAELQVKDVQKVVDYNRGDGTWTPTEGPVTADEVKAAEEGIKKRPKFSRGAYHSQFRIGERGEVTSFPRQAVVSQPFIPSPAVLALPDHLPSSPPPCPSPARSVDPPLSSVPDVDMLDEGAAVLHQPACVVTDPPLALEATSGDSATDDSMSDDIAAGGEPSGRDYRSPDTISRKRRRVSNGARLIIAGSKKSCRCAEEPGRGGIEPALRRKIERQHTVTHDAGARAECSAMLAELSAALIANLYCCFNHLTLAVDRVGFYKHDKNHKQLEDLVHKYAGHGNAVTDWLATEEAFTLIKPAARPENVFDRMRLANYLPDASQLERVGIDQSRADAILDEVCPGMRAGWAKDGDVVTGIFRWLKDAGLVAGLREEFRMYRHHLRLPPSQSDLGWLRNAHHTIFQQLIRMDPLYYLLYVCLRPDHATSLLSYVYYAKLASPSRDDPLRPGQTLPASKTFFRHIDLNMERVLKDDAAANIIQGSVSLTDEDAENCTEIIPGLHTQFDTFWAGLRRRQVPVSRGFVNAITDDHFTAADKEKYQTGWRKDVCMTGDARISSPLAPHGSTGTTCTLERMTALPWFVKIRADGVHLDLLESGTVDEVAGAHRNLTHCKKSPSGKANIYGSPSRPFPAAIHLETKYHLPGATVGRHSYDNWSVKEEQRVLFGADPAARAQLIRDIRADLGRNAMAAMKLVREAEAACFGEKSYFRMREKRGSVPAPADEVPAEKARVFSEHAEEIEADAAHIGASGWEGDKEDMSAIAEQMTTDDSRVLREEDKFHPIDVFAPVELWAG